MGYYITQIDSQFTIKKENIQAAWDGLIKLFKEDTSSYGKYSWIITKNVLNAKTFEDVMREARWDVQLNAETGDVEAIYFNGEKYGGDETIILTSIAPYVENGSYIVIQGEDGSRWSWKFIDGEIEEVSGYWSWGDEEDNEDQEESVKDVKINTIDESLRLLQLRYDGFNELRLSAKDTSVAKEYMCKQEGLLAAIDSLRGLRTSVVSDLF